MGWLRFFSYTCYVHGWEGCFIVRLKVPELHRILQQKSINILLAFRAIIHVATANGWGSLTFTHPREVLAQVGIKHARLWLCRLIKQEPRTCSWALRAIFGCLVRTSLAYLVYFVGKGIISQRYAMQASLYNQKHIDQLHINARYVESACGTGCLTWPRLLMMTGMPGGRSRRFSRVIQRQVVCRSWCRMRSLAGPHSQSVSKLPRKGMDWWVRRAVAERDSEEICKHMHPRGHTASWLWAFEKEVTWKLQSSPARPTWSNAIAVPCNTGTVTSSHFDLLFKGF